MQSAGSAPGEAGGLAARRCVPCRGGEPLSEEAAASLSRELGGTWRMADGKRLEREFSFKNFRQAMALANAIAALAEEQGHHPEMRVGWGRLGVSLFTHAVGGLHETDFIMAAKIDRLADRLTDLSVSQGGSRMAVAIPQKVLQFLSGKIGWVGTASADGMPNIAIKGSLRVLDDGHLLFADLFSRKTRQNLEQNPKVAVMVADAETHEGYILKGTAELLAAGELYSRVSQELARSPKKLPAPKYVVKIAIDEVYDQSLGANAGGRIA